MAVPVGCAPGVPGLLGQGRNGAVLTEASAMAVLPRRARPLAFPALEALTRDDLAEPVLEDGTRPVLRPVKPAGGREDGPLR